MSKANPRKAVAALLPTPIRCGKTAARSSERSAAKEAKTASTIDVRPMTLGMWAALERIDSPLVTGKQAKDTLELLPSLYLLTHDPKEIFEPGLAQKALDWADTLPTTALEEIRRAAYAQIGVVTAVVPEATDDDKKKSTTAGSRSSSPTRRGTSAGATTTSCGKRRFPQSPSPAGKTASRPTRSSRSR